QGDERVEDARLRAAARAGPIAITDRAGAAHGGAGADGAGADGRDQQTPSARRRGTVGTAVSKPPRPEPGVSYAADPIAEFAEARALEAAASLGRVLGVGAAEARAMLE